MIKWTYPGGRATRGYSYCSDPVLAHGRVYVRDLAGTVRALVDDGNRAKLLWKRSLGPLPGDSFRRPFQMIADHGGLYVARQPRKGSDEYLVECCGHDGECRWQTALAAAIPQLAVDGAWLIAAAGETLYAYSRKDGAAQWQLDIGSRILSLTTNGDGTAYAGCGDGRMIAIDLERQRIRWGFSTGLQVRSPARVHGNRVYFGSNDGFLYAVEDCWEAPYLRWKFRSGSYIRHQPTLDSNVVYFSSWDSHVYALEADSGREVWRFRINNYGDSAVQVDSRRRVAWFMSVYNLFAVNSQNGELLCERKINRAIYACNSPALDRKTGCLYVASGAWREDGRVTACHPDCIRPSMRPPSIKPLYPRVLRRSRTFSVFSDIIHDVGIKDASVLCQTESGAEVQRFPMVRGGRRLDWEGWAGVVPETVTTGDRVRVAVETRSISQPDQAHRTPFRSITIKPDESPGAGWYPGDAHCHSEFYNTIPLIEQAQDNGLYWITSTGHTGIAFRREMEALTTGTFVPIVGDEIGDPTGHCLSYEADSGLNQDATAQEWTDQINREGGMMFYAHCTFALDQTGWRGTANWDEGVTSKKDFGEQWNQALNQGRRLLIIEGSDKRRDPMPCTYVYVQELNKDTVLEALARGRYFVAYPGVTPDRRNDWCHLKRPVFYELDLRVNGRMMGEEVKVRKNAEIEITIQAAGRKLKSLELLRGNYSETERIWTRKVGKSGKTKARLNVPVTQPCWLRVEGFAGNGALCLRSNPIFVRC